MSVLVTCNDALDDFDAYADAVTSSSHIHGHDYIIIPQYFTMAFRWPAKDDAGDLAVSLGAL